MCGSLNCEVRFRWWPYDSCDSVEPWCPAEPFEQFSLWTLNSGNCPRGGFCRTSLNRKLHFYHFLIWVLSRLCCCRGEQSTPYKMPWRRIGEVEVWLYPFFTSTLDGAGWSTPHPAAVPSKRSPGANCTGGWVGLREEQKLNVMKCLALCLEMRHDRSVEDPTQLGSYSCHSLFIIQLQRQAGHVASCKKKCVHSFDRKT